MTYFVSQILKILYNSVQSRKLSPLFSKVKKCPYLTVFIRLKSMSNFVINVSDLDHTRSLSVKVPSPHLQRSPRTDLPSALKFICFSSQI